ncbi:hypothetical protein ABZ070_31615 [Streptomyces sp. NPDC006283]|uniref:hypothetical protein n=1 Tax=Streptomyces sp. NPDC006283 TaxID=3156741 RepID=UPI0033A5F0C4
MSAISGCSLDDLERRVQGGDDAVEGAENWEQLRELSVGRMQSDAYSTEIRIRWGHLALTAISGKHASAPEDPKKAVAESALVRAYMIRQFGESEEDEARRIGDLCAYVKTHLDLTRADALRLAAEYRRAPGPQMLHLRRIKNMLTPLAVIQDMLQEDDPTQRDITEWLPLIPELP